MSHPAAKEYTKRARQLRKTSTQSERKLWDALQELYQSRGLKFRRQKVVEHFIADFYCAQAKLVIELDGLSHDSHDKRNKDNIRTARLKKLGYHVLRFNDADIRENSEGVILKIIEAINSLSRVRGRGLG